MQASLLNIWCQNTNIILADWKMTQVEKVSVDIQNRSTEAVLNSEVY